MIRPSVRRPHCPPHHTPTVCRRSYSRIADNIAKNNYKHTLFDVDNVHHFKVHEATQALFASADTELACLNIPSNKRLWTHKAPDTLWKYPIHHNTAQRFPDLVSTVSIDPSNYLFPVINVLRADKGRVKTTLSHISLEGVPPIQISENSIFVKDFFVTKEFDHYGKLKHEYKGLCLEDHPIAFEYMDGRLFTSVLNELEIDDTINKKVHTTHFAASCLKIIQKAKDKFFLAAGMPGSIKYHELLVEIHANKKPTYTESYRFERKMENYMDRGGHVQALALKGDRVFLATSIGKFFVLDKSLNSLIQLPHTESIREAIFHLSIDELVLAVGAYSIQFFDPDTLKLVSLRVFEDRIKNVFYNNGRLFANMSGKIHLFDYNKV